MKYCIRKENEVQFQATTKINLNIRCRMKVFYKVQQVKLLKRYIDRNRQDKTSRYVCVYDKNIFEERD